jgi:hypothetical protein
MFNDTLFDWAMTVYAGLSGMSFEQVAFELAGNNEVVIQSIHNIFLAGAL